MDKQTILFPSEEEKNQSIALILAKGMPKPQHIFRTLAEMLHTLGIRGIFFGVGDSVFLAILCTVCLLILTAYLFISSWSIELILLFGFSPFLYASLQSLTTWKEHLSGTYEQKMVCKYSLHQVNILRMLLFGGSSVFLCIGVSLLISIAGHSVSLFFRLLGISFSALFLFAVLELLTERHTTLLKPARKLWSFYFSVPLNCFLAPLIWAMLCTVLVLFRNQTSIWLLELPVAVFWVIAIAGAVTYFKLIRDTFFKYKEGAVSYAVN